MSFHIKLVDLLEELNGAGLIITDMEEVISELEIFGIDTENTTIAYDDEEGAEND